MMEEKVSCFWEVFLSDNHLCLTPAGEAFLATGKNPRQAFFANRNGHPPKLYIEYPRLLVKALKGEQAETAKRMLRMIAQVRAKGIINEYNWKEEVQICYQIGFGFDEILRGSVFHGKYAFHGAAVYELAQWLFQRFSQEAEAYADVMLRPQQSDEAKRSGRQFKSYLEELLYFRKSDPGVYVMMDLGCCLLLEDREKYVRYLPVLEQCAEYLKDEFLAAMLYHMWKQCAEAGEPPLSQKLLERLKELILTEVHFNVRLENCCVKLPEYPAFLQALGVDLYPRYFLAATHYSLSLAEKARIFRELFHSDRRTFMTVYGFLKLKSNIDIKSFTLGLLAILLQDRPEMEKAEAVEINYSAIFNACFSDSRTWDAFIERYLLNETLSPEEAATKANLIFPNQQLQHPGSYAALFLQLCAPLYTYVPRVKRLFQILLAAARRRKDEGNLASIYGYFLKGREIWLGIAPEESAALLVADGFTYQECFQSYCASNADSYSGREGVTDDATAFLAAGHKEAAVEILEDKNASPAGRTALLALLYGRGILAEYGLLADLLRDKSKQIRGKCEELLYANEGKARPLLEEGAPKLKGEAARAARRLFKRWDNERKFGKDFNFTSNALTVEFCTENYDADAEKSVDWLPTELFEGVRYADLTEKAPAVVARYVVMEYVSLIEPYRIQACDRVVERLHLPDWQDLLENVYQAWLDQGAEAKKKAVLLPYCIYGADSQLIRLRRQMEAWAKNARGALAAYAVGAIALNGNSVALLIVDAIAAKFPNKQVKSAARTAFSHAAVVLGVPEDALADRIVPDLGFSVRGEKTIEYGARKFTIALLPDFTLSIYDEEKGKHVKSLPKPGAKDDPVLAEKGRKEYSELKKQMKAVVQTQAARLEKALMNGRRWTAERWRMLFVNNAIMHCFATGLIWGVYEGRKLQTTFRYLEDGTFNTVEEEEYVLPEQAQISLVHPIEMDGRLRDCWKRQLEEYEVVQPVRQLAQPVVLLADRDLEGKNIVRYQKQTVTAGKLTALAKKYDLQRGEVLDGGCYTCFYLADAYLNIGAQINFEYLYMGIDFEESVTLETIRFYRLSEHADDDLPDNSLLDPKSILPRFVSSVLAIMDGLVLQQPSEGEKAD